MILRSFAIRVVNGGIPRQGSFTAKVSEFLGLAPRPDGFAVLTLCDEQPKAQGSILTPAGFQPSAELGAQRWDFFCRVDGEAPPAGRTLRAANGATGILQPRPLGGVAYGDGVIFVFITPHDAPEGAEFL